MNGIVRIMLVEDHLSYREAIAQRLCREPGFVVCSQAGTADEALKQVQAAKPDVILMDVNMPGRDCFDVARTILAMLPNLKLAFLSAFVGDHHIQQALHVKAMGYITKSESLETVIGAVHKIANGESFFSRETNLILEIGPGGTVKIVGGPAGANRLSQRELEILRYIGMEKTDKEIGAIMGRSWRTVNNHVDRMMKKLKIHTRVGLVRYGISNGIL